MPAKIRFNPVYLHTLAGKLLGATRDEGDVVYVYEDERIVREEVGKNAHILGDYNYDRHGRLESIEYSDGITITAQYGSQNELVSLVSSAGRTVTFAYQKQADRSTSEVSPTKRTREFHSAIAILRMTKLPVWMQVSAGEKIFWKDPGPVTPTNIPIVVIEGERPDDPSGISVSRSRGWRW